MNDAEHCPKLPSPIVSLDLPAAQNQNGAYSSICDCDIQNSKRWGLDHRDRENDLDKPAPICINRSRPSTCAVSLILYRFSKGFLHAQSAIISVLFRLSRVEDTIDESHSRLFLRTEGSHPCWRASRWIGNTNPAFVASLYAWKFLSIDISVRFRNFPISKITAIDRRGHPRCSNYSPRQKTGSRAAMSAGSPTRPAARTSARWQHIFHDRSPLWPCFQRVLSTGPGRRS
jgi:hypothetical protein